MPLMTRSEYLFPGHTGFSPLFTSLQETIDRGFSRRATLVLGRNEMSYRFAVARNRYRFAALHLPQQLGEPCFRFCSLYCASNQWHCGSSDANGWSSAIITG